MADRHGSPPRNGQSSRNQDYVSVPRTPYSPPRARGSVPPSLMRSGSGNGPHVLQRQQQPNALPTPPKPSSGHSRNQTVEDVQMHNLGGGFGPYAHYGASPIGSRPSRQNDRSRSTVSSVSDRPLPTANPYTNAAPAAVTAPLWDQKDELDPLHDPDPLRDARDDHYCDPLSGRGWLNMSAVLLLCFGLVVLFAGYPIITWAGRYQGTHVGYNLGGINGSGQVPVLPGLPNLIDSDTPKSAQTRTGYDGKKYNLVFSDEFNLDGRTFWPGDDPFWEAVDLHYWPTSDLEWYSPDAITTVDGNLVITMTEERNHDLNFRSGMLQSWNKFCYSSGYIEVNVSLPGAYNTAGFWPSAWTMGNLGRAGYGATTEGMWPYSYDMCDLGTFPSQQDRNGNPSVQTQLGKDGTFSSLPGQKLSSCSCPGSDHPGPNVGTGRGVPEIDIFEAQINTSSWTGQVSQSFQIAPFDYQYRFNEDGIAIRNNAISKTNSYKGGPYQQAVSVLTDVPNNSYGGAGWIKLGFEYWGNSKDRQNSYITWYVNDVESWTTTPASIEADSTTQINARLISEEPMYIILNLGMAYNFQRQDWKHLQFPAQLMFDYVRVYQRQGQEKIGCDPSDHPTADYINKHMVAYTNPNLTTWQDAGFEFPRNSMYFGCS